MTNAICQFGEWVTVNRRASTQGGAITSQRLRCMPQPVSWTNASQLGIEGIDNIAESMPVNFIFEYTADIDPVKDTIVWNGWNHRVLTVKPNRLHSTTLGKEALGIRTSPNPS